MNTVTFWYTQLCDATDLNKLSTNPQTAERYLYIDNMPHGVSTGMAVAAQSSPNMTVNVTQGVARSGTGERISIPSTQIVNIAADSDGNSTTVVGSSNSRIVSVFAVFARNNQSAFVDGNSVSGYEDNLESFDLEVIAGAEATDPTPPTPPALTTARVLLADVTLVYGQTTVQTADIDMSSRRQDAYYVTGTTYNTAHSIRRGVVKDAMRDLLSIVNGHVEGTTDKHAAGAITYDGSGTWAGSIAGLPSTTVNAALDAVVSHLAGTSTDSGSERIGSGTITCPTSGVTLTIGAASIHNQLTLLSDSENIGKGVSPAFADSSTIAAQNLNDWLDWLVGNIAGTGGAGLVGWTSGGHFGASPSVQSAFDQLMSTSASDDGAYKIGAEAKGDLATTSVRGQLDELDTGWAKLARANTFAGAQTFDDITVSATHSYKLSSRSVTRAQTSPLIVGASGGVAYVTQAVVDIGGYGLQTLLVPHGATITAISVRVEPGSHGSVASMTFPSFSLYRTHVVTGTPSLVAGLTDPTNTLPSYDAGHEITIDNTTAGFASGHVVDRTRYVYWVQLYQEHGTNSVNGGIIHQCRVTYTTAAIDDGY